MSGAAEKLKGLEQTGQLAEAMLVLPQIVAVVEAAEIIRSQPSDAYHYEPGVALDAAIAALDEALGDVT